MADPAERLDINEPAPSGAESVSLWTIVKESVRGDVNHDFTQGPIGRAILLLAVPMVLEVALESIFAVADIFWVSHLGPDAVASVGVTESLLTMIYALAMGLGIGATAVVARRIGEKDREGAARAAAQALLLALLVSAVLGTVGALLAPRLLALMGATPAVIATGRGYATIMLGGEAAIIVLFVVNAIFRGAGDAAIAMRVLWLANIINIILGPLLIFGVGSVPGARRYRRRGGHDDRPVDRGDLRGGASLPPRKPGAGDPPPPQVRLRRDAADPVPVGLGDPSERDRHGELGGAGPHPRHLRERRPRRLHDRGATDHLRAAAVVGTEQRSRDDGGPEPRRQEARPRGEVRLACRALQRRLPHGRR